MLTSISVGLHFSLKEAFMSCLNHPHVIAISAYIRLKPSSTISTKAWFKLSNLLEEHILSYDRIVCLPALSR
ncbi:hypothetical protein ACOSP7_030090 [Xanthoceras sorbifolium]